MSKLTWIISALICAGCVTDKPLQGNNKTATGTATMGKHSRPVGKSETMSVNATPKPVSVQETAPPPAPARPIIPQKVEPIKAASAQVLPVKSQTEEARVGKVETTSAPVINPTVQKAEASAPTSLAKRKETPANIVIKGTPRKAEPDSMEKLFSNRPGRKGFVLAGAGGVAMVLGGWVFVQRNGKLKAAKEKNKSEKDEMEKAWKRGGVI